VCVCVCVRIYRNQMFSLRGPILIFGNMENMLVNRNLTVVVHHKAENLLVSVHKYKTQ